MTIAPENKPPTPMPAIALPTINALLLGAVAHTRELNGEMMSFSLRIGKGSMTYPSSKIAMALRKVCFIWTTRMSTVHERNRGYPR